VDSLKLHSYAALYWDKVNDRQRGHVCSVSGVPVSVALLWWDEIPTVQQEKLKQGIQLMVDAHDHNRRLRAKLPPALRAARAA